MTARLSVALAAVIAAGCGGSGGPAEAPLPGVTSVLVAKHGRVVRASYYGGLKATDRVPVFSITKSVVSALVGIAVAEGRLDGVDQRVADLVPGADPRIRIRHLLSMTAGYGRQLNFGDTDASSLAARPLVNRPGTTFNYDSGSSDLLAAILARVTGRSVADYARRRLFGPMGIRDVRWPGSHGGSGLLLRPRELLAFGQLYLDQGRRIVPAPWVRTSTAPTSPSGRGKARSTATATTGG
jgi:CubicO group peptidase (beta-lactamase class C family)